MGRGLKIAKATLLTMTGTSSSTNLVTVSQNLNNLGIIQNMKFTPNVTRGGLTAGTTYWILQVVSANTFSVSATELSNNVNFTPVTLTNSSTPTTLTVGWRDTGFQNPDSTQQSGGTSTNPGASYGVVGGDTGMYQPTVSAVVAIGINGTGTYYASTSSSVVAGNGTDFANVPANTNLFATYADGSIHYTGTTSAAGGNISVAVANTTATGNIIGTSGNAQKLFTGAPVVFDATFGNLVAGTKYFVGTVINAAAFTVSLTHGGANVPLTSNASVTANAIQNQITLTGNASNNSSGGTGLGDPFTQATTEAGYINRQKGKQKYLVTGTVTGLTGQCYTANVANASMLPNTMTILATYANSSTAYVESLSNYNLEIFGNTAPVLQNAKPAIGTFGTAYAANTYGSQPFPIVTINNA